MYFSLVIPAYNEEQRIGETLAHIHEYVTAQAYDWEVIVVDDGSTDRTSDIVREDFPWVKLETYSPNRGKGHAVRAGMRLARGAYRVFYDADASTPIEEVEKLWPQFKSGADIVIGSRAMPGSEVQSHQAWYRENMGRIFNVILRALGLTHFRDTQCGFKGFSAAACEIVFTRQTIEGFGFDVELLYIAAKHGMRVVQVPVRWRNSKKTTVNPITDSARMVAEAVSIRLKDVRGLYR
ncbi:MAG: glycosyltransferase family 2 protein [Candidatus Hydrogenedentes bacterium]|nr:glycosyltransferase family 2 protein [Candidatus Hydrogenedentota bacterium]